ncbi:MAG: di-heme oxidoredictase family protein [Myxococcales bacterium]|jgi:CxxC motif-containing protein (DUF1111 family)
MSARTNTLLAVASLLVATGCDNSGTEPAVPGEHGPIAEGISAPMGQPVPYASDEQLETFERGREVAMRRFALRDGLGPAFNVTFCGACHERPDFGGASGLYRNFFLTGVLTDDGAFFPGESAGEAGGVIRLYEYDRGGEDMSPTRPPVPEETNVVAQRNAIPFFGVGLLAELSDEEILRRADPDDRDGDGISGRPNYDRGFVGRFGLKSQTVSIEGFIRGPLFNHVGITTDPLTEEQRARLPVDSSDGDEQSAARALGELLSRHAQAAAPDGPLNDDDGVEDPEMSTDDLFDLVSFAMLLAAPEIEEPGEQEKRGMVVFDEIRCNACHAPRLQGPRGPLPVYSDLLLHDMGPELADGLVQKEASGSEFRTQPLWGLSAVGPYLHDGRATTVEQAIEMHGGEAAEIRDAYMALEDDAREDLLAFLDSLGGREQHSPGLLPPGGEMPAPGEYGGPVEGLTDAELSRFEVGRELFDRDFGFADGVGAPRFNGDSCRACHFEPVFGGAGPRGVNVVRHGIMNDEGEFAEPAVGTILHRVNALLDNCNRPEASANVFELRQTPHLFGLGLVDAIPREVVEAAADPFDEDGDGISGRVSITDGDRLGRFGWKAQVPTLEEFVRDAAAAELGMTLPYAEGLTFGRLHDNDDVPDPELTLVDQEVLTDFLTLLGPPPRQPADDEEAAGRGETLFDAIGCASCHTPSLEGADGPVPLYSDLLLHEILPGGMATHGIEEFSASIREFRTAPLWGISQTAPYLHSGIADTLEEAIELHDGEAAATRDAYLALPEQERQDLIEFLETL